MSFQTLMGLWSLLALTLAICCAVIVVRPRGGGGPKSKRKALLDFSANEEEGRRMESLLREALAGAQTDADFEDNYRRLSPAVTGDGAEWNWSWLNRTLLEYRRAWEITPSYLALARRLLADIPRRYRRKAEPPS